MSQLGDWWYSKLVFGPTWAWNILLGRVLRIRPWWSQIDPVVLLGARPFRRDLAVLRQLGVAAIVNTCEEFDGFAAELERLGISQLHVPTVDFTHPSRSDIDRAVAFIDESVAEGKKVYIHCKAGRGRSATVAICWLMHSRRMSLERAQQHLLDCRPHVNPRLANRPVVRQYAQDLGRERL